MRNLAALKSAARAAIVMPAVFAFADKVIQQPQTSILAAFGSFALLVLVEFGGTDPIAGVGPSATASGIPDGSASDCARVPLSAEAMTRSGTAAGPARRAW